MSDSDKTPTLKNLLKSVLFPGSQSVVKFVSHIETQARKTDWSRSLKRVEGLAVLLTLIGFPAFFTLVRFKKDVIWSAVKVIGAIPLAMLMVVVALGYIKSLVWIVEKIDNGESVIIKTSNGNGGYSVIAKTLLGLLSILASAGMVLSLNMAIEDVVVILLFSLIVVGLLIIGVSYLGRAAISYSEM